MIDLFTWATPNGRKISIALEEMSLPYKVHPIDIREGEQLSERFLVISPNNKIPAIIDRDNGVSVFESSVILTYLAEKSGAFLPADPAERTRVLEWLAWQSAGFGPMLGQLNYFVNRVDEQVPHAIMRFLEEAIRLFTVLDQQLAKFEYVAGDYSIADMAIYPWALPAFGTIAERAEKPFEHIARWQDAMQARPGVKIGMAIPDV